MESPENSLNFIFYQSYEGKVNVQVVIDNDNETVWASQKVIAELFAIDRSVITKHLSNIFEDGELDRNSVCAKFAHTADDGKTYNTNFYNLDAIISVGYRVNSLQATQFRKWATRILRRHMVKGYTLDDDRLKQGNNLFGKDYFAELLERIREIRASERLFYQKITDIFATSIDYNPSSDITKSFYATVQDTIIQPQNSSITELTLNNRTWDIPLLKMKKKTARY